jgi:hypothetical protein
MTISDEHHILKADIEGAAAALGVVIQREQREDNGQSVRTVRLELPRATAVDARFVRESFLRRAEKLFVKEVEVGSAWFDDLIFVITCTREETAAFLATKRVQQALMLLVDEERYVEIEGRELRLIDKDHRSDGRDVLAELLAIAKYLL